MDTNTLNSLKNIEIFLHQNPSKCISKYTINIYMADLFLT